MSTLRDDVRAILRADWDGRSCGSIAAELGQDAERVRYSLRALKDRKEAVKDESGLWYLSRDNIVPEGVAVTRKMPEPKPEIPLIKAGPEVLQELIDDLDKVSFVPEDKLEQVDWDARDAQPDVEFKASMPIWVLRKVLDVLEAASREAKAAGRLVP